jgi:hypothetical protein
VLESLNVLSYEPTRTGDLLGVEPEMLYEYEVDKKVYHGTRIGFGRRFFALGTAAPRPSVPGSDVAVYYDSKNPLQTVLEPGVPFGLWSGLLSSIGLSLLGLLLLWLGRPVAG